MTVQQISDGLGPGLTSYAETLAEILEHYF